MLRSKTNDDGVRVGAVEPVELFLKGRVDQQQRAKVALFKQTTGDTS